jgi:hypothetical protein
VFGRAFFTFLERVTGYYIFMKTLLPFLIFLCALTAYTQDHQKAVKSVTVNGVGLGDSYTQAVRKLGKPLKNIISEGDECIGGKLRKLSYSGLTLEFHQDSEGKFYVGSFEVSSPRWNVSGVGVGTASAAIRRKYGKTDPQEGDSRGEVLWLYGLTEDEGPGNLNFYFRKGKLVRISTFYVC